MTMNGFRVATGMTGLVVVTTVLLLGQSAAGARAPFIGITALPGAVAPAAVGDAPAPLATGRV
jgi:hypothetical protein